MAGGGYESDVEELGAYNAGLHMYQHVGFVGLLNWWGLLDFYGLLGAVTGKEFEERKSGYTTLF